MTLKDIPPLCCIKSNLIPSVNKFCTILLSVPSRNLGPLAAVECVQCQLWGGCERTDTGLFAALKCRRDSVHWHGEGTVPLLTGGLCWLVLPYFSKPLNPIFLVMFIFSFHSFACSFSISPPNFQWSFNPWWKHGCSGWHHSVSGCNSGYCCGDRLEKVLPNSSVQLCPEELYAFSRRT